MAWRVMGDGLWAAGWGGGRVRRLTSAATLWWRPPVVIRAPHGEKTSKGALQSKPGGVKLALMKGKDSLAAGKPLAYPAKRQVDRSV